MLTTEGMLKYLESQFPDKCPSIDMTDRAIWVYAGQVRLLKIMRAKFEEAAEKYKPTAVLK